MGSRYENKVKLMLNSIGFAVACAQIKIRMIKVCEYLSMHILHVKF